MLIAERGVISCDSSVSWTCCLFLVSGLLLLTLQACSITWLTDAHLVKMIELRVGILPTPPTGLSKFDGDATEDFV
jgi:hypothetical protein